MFAGWLLFGVGGTTPSMIVGHVVAVGSSGFALICAVIAAATGLGRQRVAWLFLTPGLVGWVVGDLTWAYFDVTTGARPPFPSLADGAYFLLPVFACAAALFTPRGREGIRLPLDGAIVAASLFMVAWQLRLRDVYREAHMGAYEFVVSYSYPFADLAMITMAAVILVRAGAGRRVPSALLLTGFGVIAVADTAFVHLTSWPPQNGTTSRWAGHSACFSSAPPP